MKRAIVKLYYRMVSRYRNVSYPNFTIVASPELYSISRDVLDHHYAFCFFAGSLKDNVVSFRLFNW
jgi:hypothetical protein